MLTTLSMDLLNSITNSAFPWPKGRRVFRNLFCCQPQLDRSCEMEVPWRAMVIAGFVLQHAFFRCLVFPQILGEPQLVGGR